MIKQSIAKAAQGYEPKPVSSTCGNCANFTSELRLSAYCIHKNAKDVARGMKPAFTVENYGQERNLRCALGGFAVKKTATCRQFVLKVLP